MAAKSKKNFDADAYYKALAEEKAKVIPLKDALKVTARQRAEDEAAGITYDYDPNQVIPEPTPEP